MQNFSEMQSLALSSPKETKAMKETDKHAFMHIRRGFCLAFFVFLNCSASEQHAKGTDKITPVGGKQLKI